VAHVLAAGGPVSFSPIMPPPRDGGAHAATAGAAAAAAASPAADRVPAFVPPISQAPAVYARLGGPLFGQQPVSTQLCNPQPPLLNQAPQQGKTARAPNVCQTCGHLRRLGYYGQMHYGDRSGGGEMVTTACAVPLEDRHVDADRVAKGHKRVFPVCGCARCAAALGQPRARASKKQRFYGSGGSVVESSASSGPAQAEQGVSVATGGPAQLAGASAEHGSATAMAASVLTDSSVGGNASGDSGAAAQHCA
jgi:hypothetical protein